MRRASMYIMSIVIGGGTFKQYIRVEHDNIHAYNVNCNYKNVSLIACDVRELRTVKKIRYRFSKFRNFTGGQNECKNKCGRHQH